MGLFRTLTLELTEDIYKFALKTANEKNQTLEEWVFELMLQNLQEEPDPLAPFIGSFHSETPDLAEKHDQYLGEAVLI